MYDDSISDRFIYLHPKSLNLILKDNSHITSIFYFYFLEQPENLNHQDEYSSYERWFRLIRDEVYYTSFLFFFLILDTDWLNIWEYDKYVPIILSYCICSKLFMVAFYHQTTFIFCGSSHYSHREEIFFLVLFHDHDNSFNCIYTLVFF